MLAHIKRRVRSPFHRDNVSSTEKSTSQRHNSNIPSADEHAPQGFHVLHHPSGSRDGEISRLEANIVAVHGLGGHMYKTWTHENGCLWLKASLPQDLPGCRIATFGYDSRIFGSKSVAGVEEFARQLLDGVARETGNDQSSIVFICHSLGGIVVKEALAIAHAESRRYVGLLERVKVVCFLGTPHRGSSIADFASGVARLANTGARPVLAPIWGATRHDLIQLLKLHSTELEKLTRNFAIPAEHIDILSAYENQAHPLLDRPVVTKDSALLGFPREAAIPLRGHHGSICRFADRADADYLDVLHNLKRVMSPIAELCVSVRSDHSSVLSLTRSETSYLDCIAAIDWDYKSLLEPLHKSSWSWVLHEPCFARWDNGYTCLFWVSGDAGMGKSTLLAFLSEHLKRGKTSSKLQSDGSTTAIYNVFCDAQDQKRRHATDILRSLMAQMATRDRSVLRRLQAVFSQRRQKFNYSLVSVWKVFRIALEAAKHSTIIIIIDALDAMEAVSRQKLLDWLWQLAVANVQSPERSKVVKLVLSSHPSESDSFWSMTRAGQFGSRLQLESTPLGLVEDIAEFVGQAFKGLVSSRRLTAEDAEMFRSLVVGRSANSFLWTKLVLQDIERSTVKSPGQLHRLVNNLPATLQDAYCHYLSLADKENQVLVKDLLHMLVASFRPLTVREMSMFLMLRSKVLSDKSDGDRLSSFDIKGLLGPAFKVQENKIEFVHPSVREYLLKIGEDRGHKLHHTHGVTLGDAHEILANACTDHLSLNEYDQDLGCYSEEMLECQNLPETTEVASHTAAALATDDIIDLSQIPFFRDHEASLAHALDHLDQKYGAYRYAASYCALHIAQSLHMGRPSALALSFLNNQNRVYFENWLSVYQTARPSETPKTSELRQPLVFASYFGWHEIVRELLSNSTEASADLGLALFWAITRSNDQVVQLLLSASSLKSMQTHCSAYLLAASQAGTLRTVQALLDSPLLSPEDLNGVDDYGRTALHCAAELNHAEVLTQLVTSPRMRHGALDRSHKSALHHAAEVGSLEAAEVLLAHDPAATELRDKFGLTPVAHAVKGGFRSLVDLLTANSETLRDDCDSKGRSILSYATANLDVDIVQRLLDCGCAFSSKDLTGRNCLSWGMDASCLVDQSERKMSLCSLAAATDASVLDAVDNHGWSPLFWAVDSPGFPDAIEALLSLSLVDVNRQDHSGRTPLSWAAASGLLQIVNMLLDHDRIDVVSADLEGKTALSHAAIQGQEISARRLVQHSPRLRHQKDKNQRSPADWALLNGYGGLASWLSQA